MPRKVISTYIFKPKKKRRGVHSKNASKSQTAYKKKYRGQGRKRWVQNNLKYIQEFGQILFQV